ncbi:uncharacterized protein LOC135841811 isoform X2 [Planococcus citri]|uniref:uncharacterized protein LOC135841811 isoform X2 n=1 Tax=Planococcus citri TaxID=170843 RepID=UPI0031F9B9E7
MYKFIVFVVCVSCYWNQNNAYVIPNAGNAAGYGADNSVSDHQLDKKNPQSFFPDFPFDSVPQSLNTNDALFPANLPQFGMQFATNGLQSGLSTGYNVPFQSGNMLDPGGNQFRDIGQDMFNQPLPPNGVVTGTMQSMSQAGNQQPVFKTETFNITPDGQQVYENNRLVEESLRNPTLQTPMTPQGTPQNLSGGVQNVTPQGPSATGTQPNTNTVQQPITSSTQLNPNPTNPNYSSQVQQPVMPSLQNQQPTYPSQMPQPGSNLMPQMQQPGSNFMPQMQQPGNPMPQIQQPGNPMPQIQQSGNPISQAPHQPGYQNQPNPVLKVSSTGANTSTFISSTNGQPPQMAQNGGAYNYNYDSTQPQPESGGYFATGGYTPNMNDPNQGTYLYTQGSFPTQPNPNVQSSNPFIPTTNQNNPGMNQQIPGRFNQPMFNPNPSNPNYRQGLQNQQLPHQLPLFNNQQYNTQPGHFSIPGQIHQNINRLNGQLSSLGMPHVDPSAVVAPMTQFMQTFPTLVRNAANQGLQISKMPFDMLNAALDAFNTDLSNVRVNEFVQIPTEGGRAIVNSIEEMINQFQRNLQSYQVPGSGLARRSPEPWMQLPNFDTSQMSQYYNSIPFGTAQEKLNTMKSDILSKIQTPTFSQLNMPQMQIPQMPKMQMPQMPKIPQSSNGEPVVKMYSSSVSESTSSSSKNGGPPEVSYQAAGSKYDYDSTKENPVESDLVAMKGYTPDASDPNAGNYEAYENSYP